MSEHFDDLNINPMPVESADDMVLRMLSGATFAPGASLILPSGRKLDGNEAQAFTSAFADNESLDTYAGREEDEKPPKELATTSSEEVKYEDDPLSSRFDRWTGDPQIDRALLISRAMDAINKPIVKPTINSVPSKEKDNPLPIEATPDMTTRKISAIRRFFKRIIE